MEVSSLPSDKNLRFPSATRLGGPQGWYGRCEQEENVLPLPRMEQFHLRPARCLVTTLTELNWLPSFVQ
jgi:hypothetical protein